MASRIAGRTDRGTTASCTARSGAIRPSAPNAFLRPCHNRARSAVLVALFTSRAACERSSRSTTAAVRRDRLRGPVEFDQQDRRRIGARARGVDRGLDRPHARLVHHLQGRRDDSRRDDRRDRLTGRTQRHEVGEDRLDHPGNRFQPDRDLDRHSEHPFAAHEQPDQVGTPGLSLRGPEPGEPPVGQDHLERGDVIGGDAVLEAVGSARILGDIAADGAGALAGGVGDVVQTVRRDRLGELGVDHAGFDDGPPPRRVDREDAVHPCQGDEHRSLFGEGPAGQSRPRPPRDERHLQQMQQPEHRRDLLPVSRQDDCARQGFVGRQAIGRIGRQLGGTMADPAGPDDPAEGLDQAGAHPSVTMSCP